MEPCLHAHQAAADDHNVIAHGVRLPVDCQGMAGILPAGDELRLDGLTARGEHDVVRRQHGDLRGGGRFVQLHPYAGFLHLGDEKILVAAQVVLETVGVGEIQKAPQFSGLLPEDHFMAPAIGCDRGGHSGGPAADHQYPLMELRLADVLPEAEARLPPDEGIDAADHVAGEVVAVAAAQAADTGRDVVLLPGKGFLREIGVCDERAGHGNAVRFAGGDDLLRLLRVEHRAYRIYRDVHPLGALDRLREIRVDAQGSEGGRHIVLQALHADLHQVDVFLRLFQEADHVLHREAALCALGAADPGHQELLGADAVPNGLEDHQGEAHAFFKAAAEFVRTGVHDGGEKLGGEPAVAEMHEHGVEARQENVFRRVRILAAYLFHHLHGHGLGHFAGAHRRGSHRAHRSAAVVFRPDLHPAVGQLRAGQRPMLVDGGGELSEKGQVVVGLFHFRDVVPAVAHRYLAQVHDPRAAPGLVLQIGGVILRRTAVHRMEKHVGRRHDPVFQEDVLHAKGTEQMGESGVHA